MAEMVVEHDYEAVTITELVKRARVSPRDFYRHYDSKEACFLAACEHAVARMAQAVEQTRRGASDWRAGLEQALLVFTGAIAAQPALARLVLVEAFAAGPAALQRMRNTLGLFAGMLEKSFAAAPGPVRLPSPMARGIAGGIARVAQARLIAGCAQELPDLAPSLLEWTLCFCCQDAAALGELPPAGPEDAARPALARTGRVMQRAIHTGREERGKILDACARLVASDGYGCLTAPRIRAAAGVSRSCFDAHFEDHRDCLLAAVEAASGQMLRRAAAAGSRAESWPAGVHRAMVALCLQLARNPALATLSFVEVFSPGQQGECCRERLVGSIAVLLRRTAPATMRPSKLAIEASVGAVWGTLHEHIAAGAAHAVPRLAPVLSFFVLAPAIGARDAVAAIESEHARISVNAAGRAIEAGNV